MQDDACGPDRAAVPAVVIAAVVWLVPVEIGRETVRDFEVPRGTLLTGRRERRHLPAGRWSVYMQAEGFEDQEAKVVLGKGEKRTLRVVLQPK